MLIKKIDGDSDHVQDFLFGPFYAKIELDRCATVVRKTKKNIHIYISRSTILSFIFAIAAFSSADLSTTNGVSNHVE